MEHQDLYSGLIRLHILHHAAREPIFGLGIIEELGRHGYKLSAGTLYPVLHSLEARGYLKSLSEQSGKRFRRIYRATPLGRKVLEEAKERVRELFGELFEEEPGVDHAKQSGDRARASRGRGAAPARPTGQRAGRGLRSDGPRRSSRG